MRMGCYENISKGGEWIGGFDLGIVQLISYRHYIGIVSLLFHTCFYGVSSQHDCYCSKEFCKTPTHVSKNICKRTTFNTNNDTKNKHSRTSLSMFHPPPFNFVPPPPQIEPASVASARWYSRLAQVVVFDMAENPLIMTGLRQYLSHTCFYKFLTQSSSKLS